MYLLGFLCFAAVSYMFFLFHRDSTIYNLGYGNFDTIGTGNQCPCSFCTLTDRPVVRGGRSCVLLS